MEIKVKVNMEVTFSKSLATLTLILGFILSILLEDAAPFMVAVGVVMVIVTGQNLGDSIVKSKKCKQNE